MSKSPNKSFVIKQQQLHSDGVPHAVATVVRTISSTAAKPGMKAIVLENGEFNQGWLGGGCVTTAVRKAAKTAIKTGVATLVCLRPEELIDHEKSQNMVTIARNGCPSKGSLDIFVEPVVPLPELLIFGSGPVAISLLEIAYGFGFKVIYCGTNDELKVKADQYLSSISEVQQITPNCSDKYLVIATQGVNDVATLISALSVNPSYISFVGSRRKFASYHNKLLDAGIKQKAISEVKSPAGLNINAVTPEEIALSIMAEIVQVRRTTKIIETIDE